MGFPRRSFGAAPPAAIAALMTIALAAVLATATGWSEVTLSGSGSGGSVELQRSYGELPLSFTADGSSYVASTMSGSVALDDGGATIVPFDGGRPGDPIEISLAGAAASAPRAMAKLPGVVNDLRGDDPSKWRTEIPTFARIRYGEVYPGIAMDYHGTTGTLEYDFRLAPGADPGPIGVDFNGAPLRVTDGGALVVGSGADRIRQAAPVAFQPGPRGRDQVAARFTLHGDRVGFALGGYDRSRPLVIDPLVLSYSTFLGGSADAQGDGDDRINAVAIDATGNAYLAGETSSSNFPTTAGAYDTTRLDAQTYGADAFVTKLNPSGSGVVYSTYLGGFHSDTARAIAVDGAGNAYVAGQTNSTRTDASVRFPATAGAYASSPDDGSGDVFIAKLNPGGSSLLYSSVFGGSGTEAAQGIAVDSSGNAYVAGATDSGASVSQTPFPTANALQGSYGGNSGDAFVTKLNAAGSGLVYSTYLGGSGQDAARGIDIDSTGRAYVTGFSTAFSGNDFPTTAANRFEPVDANSADAFLSRISADGTALQYSTGLGADGSGSNDGSDYASAVAVGPTDGIAYITGTSSKPGAAGAADFDLKNQYEGRNGQCCYANDLFVAKFDTDASGASSLLYSTLIGGSGYESGAAIAVDATGAAYIGGSSEGASGEKYDVTADQLGGGVGRGSAIVTKVVQSGSSNATLGFSTTIPNGGFGGDAVAGIAVDDVSGAVYAVGQSNGNAPVGTTAGAFQTTHPGADDGFATKIVSSGDVTPPETTITGGPANGGTVSSASVTFNFSADETATFECSYDGGAYSACSSPGPGTTGSDSRTLANGPHTFNVRAKDGANNTDATPASRTFTVSVPDTSAPDTAITSGPAAGSTVATAAVSFGFSSTEGGSTFECSYDGAAFSACTTPGPGSNGSDTRALANGSHTFSVRARDGSGNADGSPASRTFTVNVPGPPPPPADTTPPETTITKAPPKSLKARRSATVTIEFAASEAATYGCALDGGAATGCTSPATFRLSRGKHTIAITATDAAGNADPSPATVEVTVKRKKHKKKDEK